MKKHVFILIALIGLVTSCTKEGASVCSEVKSASAFLIDFPDSIKVGAKYNLSINYMLESSCGSFDQFEVAYSDKTYDIRLKTKYVGCSCKIELIERTVNYEIDVDFPGVYQFRFWLADGDFDSRTLTVVE